MMIEEEKTISIKVPAGVETGNRLRVSGEGHVGDVGGGKGDLYVEINIQKHLDFEREGANLYYEKQISFPQASLGDTVEIPTIDGKVDLKIPPGTQSGTVFRLKEKGMHCIENAGLKFIQHTNSCPGDGSVSLGQAIVAGINFKK